MLCPSPSTTIDGKICFSHYLSISLYRNFKFLFSFPLTLPVAKCGGFFYLCTKYLISNMEQVNHPQHYKTYDVETIDMMIRIWGTQETISFCKLNAFKYRMRAGHKDNAEQDIKKALWYENKLKELQSSCTSE